MKNPCHIPKVLFVFGTRPEALKLAPVILRARKDKAFQTVVCLTAQHREMVDQVLRLFDLKADFDLNLMEKGQSLSGLTQRLFPKMEAVLRKVKPAMVVVQGDTTSAFAVALKAFYEKIPVAHVEAGLRSHEKYSPFPEEVNRVLVSHVADYHFAPTQEARKNLLREGIADANIYVTGNTVVDALTQVSPLLNGRSVSQWVKRAGARKIVLVTAHRRESFGKPLRAICEALRRLARDHCDVSIMYPVHLNPEVQKTVYGMLKDEERIHLLRPLAYGEFLSLMKASYLILTDSGGVQEEAPSFGKPVLVMREVSERPDGISLGVARLVGTSSVRILKEARRLIRNPRAYRNMVKRRNPYGDGRASERICRALARHILDSC